MDFFMKLQENFFLFLKFGHFARKEILPPPKDESYSILLKR